MKKMILLTIVTIGVVFCSGCGSLEDALEKELRKKIISETKDMIEKDLNEYCDHNGWEIIETKNGEFKVRHEGEVDLCQSVINQEFIEDLEYILNK